ncbi:hypothetical protein [Negativicoccus succinicivorans]|uniref:hypothetical protein n=1 Tax=Negativicoccus succinicivorans TaxID=620903 RepID=UPI00290FF5E7|nr:hypothetical protein [Negativicoccus succinicivorans]MDU5530101.1 hypothetical protein [Negativicoccus succinicivorans]
MFTSDQWRFKHLTDVTARKEDIKVLSINESSVAAFDRMLKNEFVKFCVESDLDYDPNWQDSLSNYWTRDFSDQFNFTDKEYVKLSPLLVRTFNETEANNDFKVRQESSGEMDFREYCDILFDCYVEHLYNEQKYEINAEILQAKELKKWHVLPFLKTNAQQLTQDQNKDLENDLDASISVDKKFNWDQMHEIRRGLEAGVDPSIYANPEYNWEQMRQIRFGLEDGVDVSLYADPKRSWVQMKELRRSLESGINTDSQFNWDQINQLRLGFESDVDISIFENPEYDWAQMREIRRGLEAGVDVSIYANPKYDFAQMLQIRNGLQDGLDVSRYADPQFEWNQMDVIRVGLENSIDVNVYADPKFNWYQMHALLSGLKEGLDVSVYADSKYDWQQMCKMRDNLKTQHDRPVVQLNKSTGKGLER